MSYSKKREQALKFLEWFVRDDVQQRWAELGGYTCNEKVLSSEKFRKATPYNEAFYQSTRMVKDFWATPEYATLLEQMNKRGPLPAARAPPTKLSTVWPTIGRKTFKQNKRY